MSAGEARPMGIDATLAALLDGQHRQEQRDRELSERLDRIERSLPSKFATIEEAAEATGLCATTIQRLCRAGKMPATRRGRKWLVDLSKMKPVDPDDVAVAAAKARGVRSVAGAR